MGKGKKKRKMISGSSNSVPKNRTFATLDQLRAFSKDIQNVIVAMQKGINDVATSAHNQDIRLNNNIVELKNLTSKLHYSYNRMDIQVRVLGAILVKKRIFTDVEEFNSLMDWAVKDELGIDENGNMLGEVIVNEYNCVGV